MVRSWSESMVRSIHKTDPPSSQSAVESPAGSSSSRASSSSAARSTSVKTGEKAKWNFEQVHSILHKVLEIVLWGISDNCSCQAPEVYPSIYLYIPVYTCMQ